MRQSNRAEELGLYRLPVTFTNNNIDQRRPKLDFQLSIPFSDPVLFHLAYHQDKSQKFSTDTSLLSPPLPPPKSNSSSQVVDQVIHHKLLNHHHSKTSTSFFMTAFNSTLCRILLTSYLHLCRLTSQAALNTAHHHATPRTAINAIQVILCEKLSPLDGSKVVVMMVLRSVVS
ncbi:hypothetical protein B0T13DRAFT_198555 [Neurospora crassa]|nr:hypothetical protein B0T13DRAFT_198555 [Neurospora crassa]